MHELDYVGIYHYFRNNYSDYRNECRTIINEDLAPCDRVEGEDEAANVWLQAKGVSSLRALARMSSSEKEMMRALKSVLGDHTGDWFAIEAMRAHRVYTQEARFAEFELA